MRVAILENNKTYRNILEGKIKEYNKSKSGYLVVDFFKDNIEFGKVEELSVYNAIVIKYDLPKMNGKDIYTSLSEKSEDIELAITASKNGWTSKQLLEDTKLRSIIDYTNPDNIMDWLKYTESRFNFNTYNKHIKKTYETCKNHIEEFKKT